MAAGGRQSPLLRMKSEKPRDIVRLESQLADHLTAAPYLKQKLGGKIAIGRDITAVQRVFKGVFNLEPDFRTDGSQFDELLRDGQELRIGELTVNDAL